MMSDNILLKKHMAVNVTLKSLRTLLFRLARSVNDFAPLDFFRGPRSCSGGRLGLLYSEILLLLFIYVESLAKKWEGRSTAHCKSLFICLTVVIAWNLRHHGNIESVASQTYIRKSI